MFQGIKEEFNNAWNRPNNAVVQLILINVIFFVVINLLRLIFDFGQSGTYTTIRSFLALPSDLPTLVTRPWTFFTYMFTHEGFMHILWNMLLLYWFGKLVQEFLGSTRVIGLYILGGIMGGILYVIMYNAIPLYSSVVEVSTLVGASAGVLAVVVGAAVFMPDYTMFLLLIGPVRIKYIALVVVFLSFIRITGSNAGGEIAHLGGAFMGWLFVSQLKKGTDFGQPVMAVLSFFKSFFVRQPKIKVTHRSENKRTRSSGKSSSKKTSKSEQEEIDAILDKISQSGYESLTKEEKQKLFNASKKG